MSYNLFLLVLVHHKTQKIVGTMPLYLALTFSGTQNKGFCFKEANCDTCDKKWDTHDAVSLGLFWTAFSQNIGTLLLAGPFWKQIMYCCFGHFVASTILLDVTEITKIIVLFLFVLTHVMLFQHTPAEKLLE